MSDVVWVGLITGGSAVLAGVLSQLISLIKVRMQDRNAQRQATENWQRSEALRKEGMLRECWAHMLRSQLQMGKLIEHIGGKRPALTMEEMPSYFVIQASIVALTGLPDIYLTVQRVYQATIRVERAFDRGDPGEMLAETATWNRLFKLVGQAVFTAAGGTFQALGAEGDD